MLLLAGNDSTSAGASDDLHAAHRRLRHRFAARKTPRRVRWPGTRCGRQRHDSAASSPVPIHRAFGHTPAATILVQDLHSRPTQDASMVPDHARHDVEGRNDAKFECSTRDATGSSRVQGGLGQTRSAFLSSTATLSLGRSRCQLAGDAVTATRAAVQTAAGTRPTGSGRWRLISTDSNGRDGLPAQHAVPAPRHCFHRVRPTSPVRK